MRRVPVSKQKRDANGKKLCLVCEGALPRYRSSYCSDDCWIKNTPQMIRTIVAHRDKGVCSICRAQGHRWQADHIVPVAEGGGLCGLENYRTLCLPCHKRETKKLHQRLALKRKEQNVAS